MHPARPVPHRGLGGRDPGAPLSVLVGGIDALVFAREQLVEGAPGDARSLQEVLDSEAGVTLLPQGRADCRHQPPSLVGLHLGDREATFYASFEGKEDALFAAIDAAGRR